MKCPRCMYPIKTSDWACPRCGVDLSDLTPEPDEPAPDAHLEMAYEDRFHVEGDENW